MRNIKNPKKKKTVKGMTLIECIISMLVLAVLGLMAAKVSTVVTSLMIESNHVNNKVNAEAPYGAVRDSAGIQNLDGGDTGTDVTITVSGYGTVTAKNYSTKAAADNAKDSSGNTVNCDTNMDADLQFYVIQSTP